MKNMQLEESLINLITVYTDSNNGLMGPDQLRESNQNISQLLVTHNVSEGTHVKIVEPPMPS